MTRRLEKAAELIKRELGTILLKDIVPGGALLTLTRVHLSKDLQYADAYFSVVPDAMSEKILRALQKNIMTIQQKLNRRLRMRPVPKIRFRVDTQEKEAAELEKLLDTLND